jgi:peptidoglycan hydrolase-like protein with peptidoglycan-binding domain
MSRRRIASTGVVMLIVAGMIAVITNPFAKSASTKGVVDNADHTSLSTVTREDLSSQTQVSATLGYAGSYTVINEAQGAITELPAVGRVVSQGQVLYRVSGSPVVLLYGSIPAYRSLSEGISGTDVRQLNTDLVVLGYAARSELDPHSDYFSSETAYAVELLQAHLDVTETGTLALGQAVFLPAAARVTARPAVLGTDAQPGEPVLQTTSTLRQVSIALDAGEQSEVKAGDKVIITLPDNQQTPGVISSVGTVATTPAAGSANSSPTITVLVNPTHPAATGLWDQAPVTLRITTASVHDALVVDVDALLAQSAGGYAVEVVDAHSTHHLVPVSLGLFDDADGLVSITGSGLATGQRVVVPAL